MNPIRITILHFTSAIYVFDVDKFKSNMKTFSLQKKFNKNLTNFLQTTSRGGPARGCQHPCWATRYSTLINRLQNFTIICQVMTKEQLYDLFQQVLNVKKFEHQLLYNAMQVGSSVPSRAEN